ncbi:hypothetical protein CSUI_007521, partial [Cystoisospora suis]
FSLHSILHRQFRVLFLLPCPSVLPQSKAQLTLDTSSHEDLFAEQCIPVVFLSSSTPSPRGGEHLHLQATWMLLFPSFFFFVVAPPLSRQEEKENTPPPPPPPQQLIDWGMQLADIIFQ